MLLEAYAEGAEAVSRIGRHGAMDCLPPGLQGLCSGEYRRVTVVRPFYHGKDGVLLLAHYDLRVFGYISFQIANHLVQRGVPPGAVDSQGATPLHYAACNHNLASQVFHSSESPVLSH